MRFLTRFALVAFALMSSPLLVAQDKPDISGSWQGTLQAGGQSLRTVIQVTRADKGYAGKFFSIDQKGQAPLTSVTLDGTTFKYSLEQAALSYVGTLSADGNTITGTSTQGGTDAPLTFLRATKETAWEIPAPPPPVKRMAADADPSFDVATIKPTDPDKPGKHLVIRGRNFDVQNYSLNDLISFAYQVQVKQVVGGADWMDKDKYDITAVPVEEGAPDATQLRTMLKKLLADRWKLKFHDDKRELSAYALTVVKTGSKLKETESKGPLPGLFYGPGTGGLALRVQNATMVDLTGLMQSTLLDRPVVDRTGLVAKYDFVLTFTPDDSQFNGHPPQIPKKEGVEPAPSLFDAMQQQLGLKLDAQKTMVPVIAIDHVEKPSGN